MRSELWRFYCKNAQKHFYNHEHDSVCYPHTLMNRTHHFNNVNIVVCSKNLTFGLICPGIWFFSHFSLFLLKDRLVYFYRLGLPPACFQAGDPPERTVTLNSTPVGSCSAGRSLSFLNYDPFYFYGKFQKVSFILLLRSENIPWITVFKWFVCPETTLSILTTPNQSHPLTLIHLKRLYHFLS